MNHSNDDAAAGIFTLILVFLVASLMFVLMGYGIDRFTLISSTMFSGTAASQMRFDTVNIMLTTFRAEPFILLIGIGYNYWVSEMRQFSGMADVGTMVVAAVEMVTMTLVIIAFTLFGGYAIDTIVNFINNFAVANPDLSLFEAVQYIAPVFYGVMYLIILAIIVQFIMTCVQTVDYQQYQQGYY